MTTRCIPLLACLLAPLLLGQMSMSMPMAGMRDTRPVPLVAGLGNSHHLIHTASPEAQRFFDQGMDYLFAFNHDEARRSFQRAADLDPKAAMPLWGVALAVGPNYNDIDIGHARELQAYTAISKASQLAKGGPLIEADYIDALGARYAQDANHDLNILGERYGKAMAVLVQKHPDDLDAATLYAESLMDLHPWQLWTAEGKPVPGTGEIVRTLQSVLLRDPNHVGANHFLIHAVEASSDPSLALPSAKRLESLAPTAGHLVHMPAHIYQRVGDFNGSAIANRRAVDADRAYFKAQHLEGIPTMYFSMYYTHNMHFLASSCSMEGNAACATEAASQLVEQVAPQVAASRMMEWYLPTQPWVMVRFAQWERLLETPLPGKELPTLAAMYHYAKGAAYAGTGRLAQATAERAALDGALQAIPGDAIPDFNNPAKATFQLALTALDARIAEAKGDRSQAIALWRRTVALLDTFAYNEPADWYYPVRESLGGALLRDHQAAEAEAVFRSDLERNPNNGRSLFGLWQSLLQQNKTADAALVKVQFEAAWRYADTSLSIDSL